MPRAARALVCAAGLTVPVLAAAQVQVTAPAFEVASVKANDGTGPSGQRTLPNGTLVLTNSTLRNIIRTAFGVQGAQVVGGPDWLDTDRFDVTAKAAAPFSTEEGRAMLRTL